MRRQPADQGWAAIARLSSGRPAPSTQGPRARLLQHLAQGSAAPKAAALVGASDQAARNPLKRLHEHGRAVLEEQPRPGSPREVTEQGRGRLLRLARSRPRGGRQGGHADGHWPPAPWLGAAGAAGLTISRAHLARVLHRGGVRRWRRPRRWRSSAAPAWPDTRGRASTSPPPHRRGVPGSVWRRQGPLRRRPTRPTGRGRKPPIGRMTGRMMGAEAP